MAFADENQLNKDNEEAAKKMDKKLDKKQPFPIRVSIESERVVFRQN